jgi:hypothetical protein
MFILKSWTIGAVEPGHILGEPENKGDAICKVRINEIKS